MLKNSEDWRRNDDVLKNRRNWKKNVGVRRRGDLKSSVCMWRNKEELKKFVFEKKDG